MCTLALCPRLPAHWREDVEKNLCRFESPKTGALPFWSCRSSGQMVRLPRIHPENLPRSGIWYKSLPHHHPASVVWKECAYFTWEHTIYACKVDLDSRKPLAIEKVGYQERFRTERNRMCYLMTPCMRTPSRLLDAYRQASWTVTRLRIGHFIYAIAIAPSV